MGGMRRCLLEEEVGIGAVGVHVETTTRNLVDAARVGQVRVEVRPGGCVVDSATLELRLGNTPMLVTCLAL